jgi:uncharacterized protein
LNQVQFVQGILPQLSAEQIAGTSGLLADGATLPFIARYRKEQTGGLDELEIDAVAKACQKFQKLVDRKATILKAIEEQEGLNHSLAQKIADCWDETELEDIYLPFKRKKTTKAAKARTLGLEGLAKQIMAQNAQDIEALAERFVNREVATVSDALDGASHIIQEWVGENVALRSTLRKWMEQYAELVTKIAKGKEEAAENYKAHVALKIKLKNCPSHRFMAIFRAYNEGVFQIALQLDEVRVKDLLARFYLKNQSNNKEWIERVLWQAYKKVLHPSLQTETFNAKKQEADLQSIKIFADNLEQLLMSPPLGKKRVLAIDPGFRTGCKVVCLDEQGAPLTNTTIFPHPPQNDKAAAQKKISQLVEAYQVEVIAIGDGTASRETDDLIKRMSFNRPLQSYLVSEDGASVYSASKVGREEFPMFDVTVRGAISIGRRLMDPMAELVKIDPKSLGVGQYQHDVPAQQLQEALDQVIQICVNRVGVDLNGASEHLLSHVAGIGPVLAKNIVAYRSKNGFFKSRKELLNVPRLGEKAFEQCAGFLRISDGEDPLDNSGIHPESYPLVASFAKKMGVAVKDLVGNAALVDELSHKIDLTDSFTLKDILSELKKPGRDPRESVKTFSFDPAIRSISDLSLGAKLNGIVSNITDFGAFVNIGIKENGLIHKSQLREGPTAHPLEVVKLQQQVRVEVISLEIDRKRIGLKLVY